MDAALRATQRNPPGDGAGCGGAPRAHASNAAATPAPSSQGEPLESAAAPTGDGSVGARLPNSGRAVWTALTLRY